MGNNNQTANKNVNRGDSLKPNQSSTHHSINNQNENHEFS